MKQASVDNQESAAATDEINRNLDLLTQKVTELAIEGENGLNLFSSFAHFLISLQQFISVLTWYNSILWGYEKPAVATSQRELCCNTWLNRKI